MKNQQIDENSLLVQKEKRFLQTVTHYSGKTFTPLDDMPVLLKPYNITATNFG